MVSIVQYTFLSIQIYTICNKKIAENGARINENCYNDNSHSDDNLAIPSTSTG